MVTNRGATQQTHSPVDYDELSIGGADLDIVATYGMRGYMIHCNMDGVVYLEPYEGAGFKKFAAVEGGTIVAQFTSIGGATTGTTATDLTVCFPERIRT